MENDSIWDQEVPLEQIRRDEQALRDSRGPDLLFTDDSTDFIEDDASAEDISELVELEEAEND